MRPWRRPGIAERLLGKATWRLGLNSIHALGTWSLLRDPWFEWADVVHLHNLHGAAFSYLALPALAKRKPLVWTLHDMWAITGHCAFSLGCDRWRTGCGRCPHLEVYPYAARDATRWEWRWKHRAIRRARPLLAAPSRWLGRLADEAFPDLAPARHVPYSIDTAAFLPVPPPEARAALGLPPDGMLLLSAASDLAEARKGGHLLAEALRKIPDAVLLRAALVTLGDGAGPWLADLRARGMTVVPLGYIDNPAKQALVYSAADLLLFPSMDDNLPIVVLEALACGLPGLAFAVGGVPELIATPAHGRTIRAFDVAAYAEALAGAIESWHSVPGQRASLLPHSSEPAAEAAAYSAIYRAALENRTGAAVSAGDAPSKV
jgi:glycosyltransferase involved in cell wall biosynthesis